jgi:hypothetical protein
MTEEPTGNDRQEEAAARPVEATFQQFLSGMAMQTLIHLGLMSNPITNKTEIDLVQAKYSIDLLGILEEKTRGNLTEEEENYFKPMLSQLRMGYVEALKRGPGSEGAETSSAEDGGRAEEAGSAQSEVPNETDQ